MLEPLPTASASDLCSKILGAAFRSLARQLKSDFLSLCVMRSVSNMSISSSDALSLFLASSSATHETSFTLVRTTVTVAMSEKGTI